MIKRYRDELLQILNKYYDLEVKASVKVKENLFIRTKIKVTHVSYDIKKLFDNWDEMIEEIRDSECYKSRQLKYLIVHQWLSLKVYKNIRDFQTCALNPLHSLVYTGESFQYDIKNKDYRPDWFVG